MRFMTALAVLALAGPATAQQLTDPFGARACTTCPAGPQGERGRDGKDGKPGRDGIDGRDGRDAVTVEPQDSPLYHFDLSGSFNQRLLAVLPSFIPNLRNFLTYDPTTGDISLFHQQPDVVLRETRPGSAGRILHNGLPRKLWVKGEVIAYRANGVTPHWIWLESADGDVCVVEWLGGYGLHVVLRKR
jgi:hypothetical protein